jgi:iron-sulfur cluster assembly accessory protein
MMLDAEAAPPDGAPERWAPVTLSAAAAGEFSRLMSERGVGGAGLRIFVQGGGCSGLRYGLAFVTEPEADDVVFHSQGLRVHVDPVSIAYVQGTSIDFELAPDGGTFKIDNPNPAAACAGCGSARSGSNCGGGC